MSLAAETLPVLKVADRLLLPGSVQVVDLRGGGADALIAHLTGSQAGKATLVVQRGVSAAPGQAAIAVLVTVLEHELHAGGGHRLKLAAQRRVSIEALAPVDGVPSARVLLAEPDTSVDPALAESFRDAVRRFFQTDENQR